MDELKTNSDDVSQAVDDTTALYSNFGDRGQSATNAMLGINTQSGGVPVKANADNNGYTFFTRPRLNLSYDNVAASRILSGMLTSDERNTQRAIKVLLDHEGCISRGESTPLVDDNMAFIPILSNYLISISGWPDTVMDTHTSPAGLAGEEWGMIDSLPYDYSSFDLTASFKNVQGDPITQLFQAWLHYAARVYEGSMMPYPDAIVENELDYCTRVYRVVLDPTRKFVQRIAACGYAIPYANSMGANFNFNLENPTIQDNAEISIPFKCFGAMYNDPIIIEEFNRTVVMFNPGMADDRRETEYVLVSDDYASIFNYRCYPRIGEDMAMEWWVDRELFDQYINSRTQYLSSLEIEKAPISIEA